MKKIAMTALALVLAVQAPAAFAQPGRGGGDRPERAEGGRGGGGGGWRGGDGQRGDGPRGGGGRPEGGGVRAQREWSETRGPRPAPAPQPAPQAPQAPRAAEPRAQADGGVWDGRRGGWSDQRGGGQRGDGGPRADGGPRGGGRPDGGQRPDGPRGDGQRGGGDRQDWAGRGDGRRDDGRWDGGRRDDGRRDDGRRYDGRRGDDRRDWGRNDGRRWDGDRRWDNRSYWARDRYPQSYFSHQRYRYDWRAPRGFYVRTWGYGEFFPRAWFGPSYWISDVWQYDLPLPPIGYQWVRSGPDALLIDEYTGRIVQIVRDVFWY